MHEVLEAVPDSWRPPALLAATWSSMAPRGFAQDQRNILVLHESARFTKNRVFAIRRIIQSHIISCGRTGRRAAPRLRAHYRRSGKAARSPRRHTCVF
eukprot:871108-Pleurochrysis_carterae.AAC.1